MTTPIPISEAEHQFRTRLAETLFAEEWRKTDSARDPMRARLMLRNRAEAVLDTACRMTGSVVETVTEATPRPKSVKIATEKDTAGLTELIRESDRELSIVTRNYDKVQDVIGMAVDRTPLYDEDGAPIFRPVFGVITTDGTVEAACGLFPTQPWDSLEFYLRGFFLYVAHASRRTTHAKTLLQFANWFGDQTAMPVVWELLNCRALDERSRLFSRHAMPFGGLFIHRPVEKVAA